MNSNTEKRNRKEALFPQERLKSLFHYDPETGELRWKPPTKARRKQGALAGTVSSWGYRQINCEDGALMAHRVAWCWTYGSWPTNDLDHINGNRDDNRIANLREATRSQNSLNGKRRSNFSGYKGVFWEKERRKWRVLVTIDGKQKKLGRYNTREEASEAYVRAVTDLHGPFARTS